MTKELPHLNPHTVRRTEIETDAGPFEVSTVRLDEFFKRDAFLEAVAAFAGATRGYLHSGYETMVFDPNSDRPLADLYARHYTTREAALQGHQETLDGLAHGRIKLRRDRENLYDPRGETDAG